MRIEKQSARQSACRRLEGCGPTPGLARTQTCGSTPRGRDVVLDGVHIERRGDARGASLAFVVVSVVVSVARRSSRPPSSSRALLILILSAAS